MLLEGKKVCALLGGRSQLSGLCEKLVFYGLSDVVVTAGERLSYPEERIRRGRPEDFIGKETDSLTIALLERTESGTDRRSLPGLPDDSFSRAKVPMTKEEIRVLSLAKLNLKRDSIVYDIGSGSGSVGIEAALFATEGKVYAIEKKEEAYALTGENARKHRASNLLQIRGEAPGALQELPAPTHGFTLSNIECIWDPYGQDTHISSHHMRGVPVKIYKATPENCPDGKVIPCAPEDGTQIICDASDPRLKEWLPNYDIREEA